ncbi:MAG: 8-amino-7-oxononanoate synthase [Planctomycetota bacterium]|jgi:8-amino-7-oxononanoate synthase
MDRAFERELREELDALTERGQRRSLVVLEANTKSIDFSSNDYLGLARHPLVVEAGVKALREFGAGARASRLLGGGSKLDAQVEEALADWMGAQTALLFPTGFQANLGLVTTLARRGDTIFSDAHIHASLVDASRLSKATTHVFAHNNMAQLEALLANRPQTGRRIVLTEGIYSMSGELAPLVELQRLCLKHDAWLVVDEAHAIGVVGPAGAGAWATVAEAVGSDSRLLARVVTGGKALGAGGGLIVGSYELREILLQSARSFIFTTGTPPAVAGALLQSIELARAANKEREVLQNLGARLAGALGVEAPEAAILPFTVGENEPAVVLAESLRAAGIDVRAVRPPTVPKGQAGLRIVLHSYNKDADLDRLAGQLGEVQESSKSIPTARRKPIFVAGTDTDVGKTVVSAVLLRSLARQEEITYWKPVQTGDDSDTQTVRQLCEGKNVEFATPSYAFPLAASPHEAAAAAESTIEPRVVHEQLEAELVRSEGGALLVELAGGVFVPYDNSYTQLDWLASRKPRIVLVARSGLGTLNHTLLTVHALANRGLKAEALFLVGEPHASNRATLARMTGIAQIIELPLLAPLTPATIDHWLNTQPQLLP